MTLQAVKHGVPFPSMPLQWATNPTFSSLLIDAAGEKAAIIFSASAAKSIHKIHFRTGTVTVGDTVDVRVETVDSAANGDPTGTLWSANSNGSSVIASSDDNVWKTVTLTADALLAIGNVVAIVIVNGGAGGNINIATYGDHATNFPYNDLFTASWAKGISLPVIVPEYSDGSFEPIFGYSQVGGPLNITAFNSGSTTNRIGNIFQLPFPARAKGAWAWVDADGDYTIKLYDSDGSTVLATTATISNFQRQSTGAGPQFHPFTTTANLSASLNYRLAIVPSTVTNLSVYDFDVPAAGMLDMFAGGQSMHASVFTSGAWVQTTTRRVYVGVFLDAFDDALTPGSGGGGPLVGGRLIL